MWCINKTFVLGPEISVPIEPKPEFDILLVSDPLYISDEPREGWQVLPINASKLDKVWSYIHGFRWDTVMLSFGPVELSSSGPEGRLLGLLVTMPLKYNKINLLYRFVQY